MAAVNAKRTDTSIPDKNHVSQFLSGVADYEPSYGDYDQHVNRMKSQHLQKPRDEWERATGQEYIPQTEPMAENQRESGNAPSK